MASLVVSTVAYFVAAYLIKRRLDDMDVPRGMTRSLLVFALALAVAYGAAWVVDHVA